MGSDTGLPDVWIPMEGAGFYPLELKRGMKPLSRFEPSQRKFHKLSLMRGCPTFCLSIINSQCAVGYRMSLEDSEFRGSGGELEANPEVEFRIDSREISSVDDLNWCSLRAWLKKSAAR